VDLIVANRILPVSMNTYEMKTMTAMARAARRLGKAHVHEAAVKATSLGRTRNRQTEALQNLQSRLNLPVQQVPMVPAEGLPRVRSIAGHLNDRVRALME
jgi:hypothetical protein